MVSTILVVFICINLWIGCGALNYMWYHRVFDDAPIGQPRDFIVCLGPIGTLMLALCTLLMVYTKLSYAWGDHLMNTSNFILIPLSILGFWIGAGAANHVWYERLFKNSNKGMDRDLLMALGPIGSFMLLLCAAMDGFLKLCAFLAEGCKCKS